MEVKEVVLLEWLIKEITMQLMDQMDLLRKCKTKAIQKDQIPKYTEAVDNMEIQTSQRIEMGKEVLSDRMECKYVFL